MGLKKQRNKYRKRRAIYLLTACQQDEEAVANELGVKKSTIKRWMEQPDFAKELEKAMQRVEGYDSKHRSKQNKVIGDKLYRELHRRIATTRELQDMPLSTLFTKIREINHEIRVDTGDATSRDESKKIVVMDDLVAKYQEMAKQQGFPTLRLVEPPGEEPSGDDKKEGTND